ncbi:MAG: Na(+)/H(+) antiporter subunit B [Deltaproteobacteria bacterium]|nr:Na(+)/H(+) antiporter subunit B [Deltaproteobacteria bacterium]MBW2137059.1 Na(+)/H(+) antiporter subunit B [Deltaproteobacteria bacterium]
MIAETQDIIVKTVSRVLAPFIVLYALYVVMHGHHSPGGGFQGGVILAASFVLLTISFGFEKTKKRMSDKLATVLSSLGVFIYAGIGLLCLVLGGKYLDYGFLREILGVVPPRARSLGILGVEIGVAIAVMAVMCIIVFTIFTSEEESEATGERDG